MYQPYEAMKMKLDKPTINPDRHKIVSSIPYKR